MRILILVLSTLIVAVSHAQFQNILISTTNDPEEVSIAINPKNTNQIIAGANLNNRYKSNDGGLTWQTGFLTCAAYSVYGDPVMFWDTTGAAYYMHLSNPPASTIGGSWVDRIVIQKSTDAGATYPQCVGVGKNGTKVQDKAWHAVSPFDNSIHISWTQFDAYESSTPQDSSLILYSKSLDGGVSWTNPKRLSKFAGNCMDNDTTVEGAVPAIGQNNEVYVAWSSLSGIMFQKSLDGGNTWLPQEQLVTTTPGGWVYDVSGIFRCNGLPFTMCDLSNGPNRGTIYINWSDQRAGTTDVDVFVIKSTDGGTTWSAPVRVNNDVPGKIQFMSSMCVDQATGFVYVVFYDRRNYTNNNTDVYLAVSKDGGVTFQNYKVNQNSFNPNGGVFFGDYIGISAHNNVVRPIWMQLNGTALSVYTAIIDGATLTSVKENENVIISLTAKPNPTSTETQITYALKSKSTVSIQLINNEGKVITDLITNKKTSKGNHELIINKQNLNLNAGLYYVIIYANNKSKYLKLVVE
jgi:hypothetical protein